jgi:hypothetical protein
VLVTHPSTGVNSVKELLQFAKAKQGQLAYASSSIGNLTHLAAELFSSLGGVKMLHVPFKGGRPAMTDLLGGRVAIFFSTVAVARPHIQSGKMRELGVTTAKRTQALPNVRGIAEAGVPGYEVSGWYGMVAPGGGAEDRRRDAARCGPACTAHPRDQGASARRGCRSSRDVECAVRRAHQCGRREVEEDRAAAQDPDGVGHLGVCAARRAAVTGS